MGSARHSERSEESLFRYNPREERFLALQTQFGMTGLQLFQQRARDSVTQLSTQVLPRVIVKVVPLSSEEVNATSPCKYCSVSSFTL